MKTAQLFCAAGALLLAFAAGASGRVAIVSEHEVAEKWKPAPDAPRVVVGYPASVADKLRDVCVNIGFMIEMDGSTSNFSQVKSWSSATPDGEPAAEQLRPFVQSAAAAVSMWKFVPATDKPRQVYTSAAFVFEGSQSPGPEAIRARCRIENLTAFVNQAKSRQAQRGDLERGRQERNRQENQILKGPSGIY